MHFCLILLPYICKKNGVPLPNAKVHQRISAKHPEISDTDVLAAWDSCIRTGTRNRGAYDHTVAVGFDNKGRFLEMVAVLESTGIWHIFHAMTPPSRKTLMELNLDDERS
jgi:hypothetical protein